jgi:hypothetical protein
VTVYFIPWYSMWSQSVLRNKKVFQIKLYHCKSSKQM